MKKRVVITGLGVVSSIGKNVEEYFNNIKNNIHGISRISSYDTSDEKVVLASEIKDFNFKEHFSRKEINRLDRFSAFGIIAAREAYIDSKLIEIDPYRLGISIGTGLGGVTSLLNEKKKFDENGMNTVSPLLMVKSLSNILAGNLAIEFNAKNSSNTIITACASGTNAIGEAYLKLQNGLCDVMIAGGSEACIDPTIMAGFTNMNAVSRSKDVNKASIPFDKNRDGFILGEGAGILILETLEHAINRNAKIYAEITGYGYSNDSYHLTAPHESGSGAKHAIKMALNDSEISPKDVSYINAHGTSTPKNDEVESLAIKEVFNNKVAISSTKSFIGHLQGAAGAVEAITCVKSIENNYIHENLNFISSDLDYGLNYLSKNMNIKLNYVLSNSFGFGGHNACLIIKAIS